MKIKSALGLIGVVMLILSAFAHSILGWNAVSEQLAMTNTPWELVAGLKVAWMFGGPTMLVFAAIALPVFVQRWRGNQVSTYAPAVIGVMYTLFGLWALSGTGDPFFMVFVVPGVLITVGSIP